ncbi:MAG: hypothetical protein LBP34_01200 [Flavobacteriaceae bacterium]|jgi:hypothetical protein|nr:hypothetical protein [Flavobacteriaceae bacterium]
MKLQNKPTKSKVTVVNITTLIIFFTSLAFIYLDIPAFGYHDEMISVISLVILLYLTYLGCPFFMYDSEGETLIFQNQKALPFSFFVKEIQSDFPKRKLKNFNIKNRFFFKKILEIYISSKRVNSGLSKIDFDISYLSAKQIRDLRTSLKRVLHENTQYQQNKEKL